MEFGDYKRVLSATGSTARERSLTNLSRDLQNLAPDSIASKGIIVNGRHFSALVRSTNSGSIKEFSFIGESDVSLGSILRYANQDWIVHECDLDNEAYAKCSAKQCNCILRWKSQKGIPLSRSGYAEDATKYSEGTTGTSMLRVGEFQIKIILPLDKDTVLLRRGHRFLIDADAYIADLESAGVDPSAFRVTRRNVITGTRPEVGYVELTLCEDQFVQGPDDAELMIAVPAWELSGTNGALEQEENDDPPKNGGWL